jgi:hypothetical protein
MKTNNQKKYTIIAGVCCAVLLIVFIFLHATSDWRVRRSIKSECGVGMDCVCFSNVIDNRLDKNQVRAFRAFLTSVKKRPTTNILEFIDEKSARGISEVVSLCRPTPVQPKTKGKK